MQNEVVNGRRLFVAVIENGVNDAEDAFAEAPVQIHAMSVSIIEPCARPEDCEIIESEFASYDWLFFSSANAVKVFFETIHIGANQNNPKIACVGPGTRDYLERLGLKADFVAKEHSGESFASEFLSLFGAVKVRVLIPQPETVAFDLAGALERGGALVTRFVLYRTLLLLKDNVEIISWRPSDIFAFMSPSGVRNFSNLYAPPLNANVFAIGPSTASEAEKLGFNNVRVAKSFTRQGLLDAIIAFLDNES